jgi:esterase/lipase superfamily enzyme
MPFAGESTMVDLLFATNRAFVSDGQVASFASGRASLAGDLICGVATVDQIDITKSTSGEITKTDQLVMGNFTAEHRSRIIGSNRDVLGFVHGAANSFVDEVTRTAYNQACNLGRLEAEPVCVYRKSDSVSARQTEVVRSRPDD